ncbi:MAG: 2-dehydropantoate 2-reductase [Phycisphaerae bacterium]|nr:2-dehydropantoate 2-reductase [Phycisphaerae bacterium]
MKIAVVGAGAMGGYYGAMLARHNYDVHFLMRSDYPVVKQNGLTIKSCNGDFHLEQVNCYKDTRDMPPVDLVFIGLKTTDNDKYEQLLSPLAGGQTRFLSAQNGLGNEEQLAGLFGKDNVAGAVAFICCNRRQPGVIDHLDYGHIHIGNFNRPADATLTEFGRMLNESQITCKVVDDMAMARWQKLIWNVPFNGLSTALDLTADKIVGDPHHRDRAWQLMLEVQAAAAANGVTIETTTLEQMMTYTDTMAPYYTSMHLDRLAHRPMEIESIIGEPLRRGLAKKMALPEMQKLYNTLSALQKTNRE